jgi:polygalacturonase
MENDRRDFLRLSGAGIAGATLPLHHSRLQATTVHPNVPNYDVRHFGATADGHTLDTPAINRAIEAVAAAGGGTLRFPAGHYLCYSIHLKSNVALFLDQGATIIAADTPSSGSGGYDLAESNKPWENYQDFGHNHWHNSLIWGEGLENVSIYGPGLIWGRGLDRGTGDTALKPGVGNKAIALKNCRNVILRDFSILKAGHFGILATGVDNLTIDNLKIDTDRDGMDIDCCRNVRVSNCAVNSPWDDAICPKSSFALGHARATENLTIANCYVTGVYKLGTMLEGTWQRFNPSEKGYGGGRIKFGTESNGGFKNITVSNCVFEGCFGLALETEDGALLEDVTISNITMRDVACPIFMRLGARMRGPKDLVIGKLRRVIISNLVCSNALTDVSSIITGIPGHPIEDIQLHDIYIQHRGGGAAADAALQLAEKEADYPEPTMFGRTPCQGLFLRHARNVVVSNLEIAPLMEDRRPAFVLDDVKGADFFRVRTPKVEGVPAFALKQVEDFSVGRTRGVADRQIDKTAQETL